MKRINLIFSIMLAFALLVGGCTYTSNSSSKHQFTTGQTTNLSMTTLSTDNQANFNTHKYENSLFTVLAETPTSYQFKDDEYYLDHYIYGLDLCLPDLAFEDANNVTADNLYLFFCWIVDYEKLFNYQEWFDANEKKYHVPAKIIEPTLKKYLDINSIDLSAIKGYDKDKDEMNIFYAGWGGGRWAKLDKKEYLGNDTLRLTATFYNDTYTKRIRTNVYIIKVSPENEREYKYLGIRLGHDYS